MLLVRANVQRRSDVLSVAKFKGPGRKLEAYRQGPRTTLASRKVILSEKNTEISGWSNLSEYGEVMVYD